MVRQSGVANFREGWIAEITPAKLRQRVPYATTGYSRCDMLYDLIHAYVAAFNNLLLIVCAVVFSSKSSTSRRYIVNTLAAISLVAAINLILYSLHNTIPGPYIITFLWTGDILCALTIGVVIRSLLYLVRRTPAILPIQVSNRAPRSAQGRRQSSSSRPEADTADEHPV